MTDIDKLREAARFMRFNVTDYAVEIENAVEEITRLNASLDEIKQYTDSAHIVAIIDNVKEEKL